MAKAIAYDTKRWPELSRFLGDGRLETIGYNAQVAVDAKHSLIVEQHVTNA